MSIVRKYKIAKLLNNPIDEKIETIFSFVNNWMSELEIVTEDDKIFYFKKNNYLFEYHTDNHSLFFRYEEFYEILKHDYNVSDKDIYSLIKYFFAQIDKDIIINKYEYIMFKHYEFVENFYNEKKISKKYSNIEDKIPSVWESYEKAGIELAQDLAFIWNAKDAELIRVISVINLRVKNLQLNKHIDDNFTFAGLYPNVMKSFDIVPDNMDKNTIKLLQSIGRGKRKNE